MCFVAQLPPTQSGMRGRFGWRQFDQLKRQFSGFRHRDTDALPRFESRVFEPIATEADSRFYALSPKIAGGFNFQSALIASTHGFQGMKKESRSSPLAFVDGDGFSPARK